MADRSSLVEEGNEETTFTSLTSSTPTKVNRCFTVLKFYCLSFRTLVIVSLLKTVNFFCSLSVCSNTFQCFSTVTAWRSTALFSF